MCFAKKKKSPDNVFKDVVVRFRAGENTREGIIKTQCNHILSKGRMVHFLISNNK